MYISAHQFVNCVTKATYGLMASVCCFAQAEDSLSHKLHEKVLETINHSSVIPGLQTEEFNALKDGIIARWHELVEKGVLEVTATDKETRPYFVALQGVVEHVLANELNLNVKNLTGIIHTPMPATPLCTKGEVSNELVDPSIASDPLRLFTVKARTTIVRDFLYQGGDLYVTYPKEGLAKRTAAQQEIYRNELQNYPAHLFDRPLTCDAIDHELIGATYFFTSDEGKKYVFAIKMTQANNPQESGQFGLWFGPADHPAIQARVSSVLRFLGEHGAPLPG